MRRTNNNGEKTTNNETTNENELDFLKGYLTKHDNLKRWFNILERNVVFLQEEIKEGEKKVALDVVKTIQDNITHIRDSSLNEALWRAALFYHITTDEK